MRLRRRHSRGVPTLNTASLPDLIFTVLFFFMIVTHMRNSDVKVKYEVPKGTELSKVQHKSAVSYLYVGKDKQGKYRIQLNNNVIPIESLAAALMADKERLSPEEQEYHTVSVKADRDTPLFVIAKIKDALSMANTLQVNYSANEEKQDDKK